jgi:hypothetical protein
VGEFGWYCGQVLLQAAMAKLERRGGSSVVWPKVDPIALMDARHASTRAAREARLQRRAAAAEAAGAPRSGLAARIGKPVTATPPGKTPRAQPATKRSPLDGSPSPPAIAGAGILEDMAPLAEVRRKLVLDDNEGTPMLSSDVSEALNASAEKTEVRAAEAAPLMAQSDAAAVASAQAEREADMLEAAVRAAEADLQRVTAETEAKEAAQAAEAARLTRLRDELDKIERAVREQTEARRAAAAKQEALHARRQQLSGRIARRRSRERFLLWQHATECARMQLVRAERHQVWRRTDRAWRIWIRWVRIQLAEAAARAHEQSLRRAHAAKMLAIRHFSRVTMRAAWDHIVCAVNIIRQETLIAAEQARRQDAANRLLAQRKLSCVHSGDTMTLQRCLPAAADRKLCGLCCVYSRGCVGPG